MLQLPGRDFKGHFFLVENRDRVNLGSRSRSSGRGDLMILIGRSQIQIFKLINYIYNFEFRKPQSGLLNRAAESRAR